MRSHILFSYIVVMLIPVLNCATIRGSGSAEMIKRIRVADNNGLLPSTGSSTSKPVLESGVPQKTKEAMVKCYNDPRPKPVCFSCDDAVRIINARQRLDAWPTKHKQRMEAQKKQLEVQCRGDVEKQKSRTDACEKREQILIDNMPKQSDRGTVIAVSGTIGLLIGLTAGVLLTVLIVKVAVPVQQQIVF